MKASKILIRIGLVLLVIVTVALVVRAVFNYTEGRKLASVLAELKAKGSPTSAKDLAHPCPDADNAARLWTAAESLLVADANEKALINRAFLDLVADKPIDPEHRTALGAIIAKNAQALRLMRDMADKPCFLHRDSDQRMSDTMVPQAAKLILGARLMGFDALFAADAGDVGSGIEKAMAGLGFASKLTQEGTLIDHLLAVADARLMIKFLGSICKGRSVPDDNLLRLVAGLDPIVWRQWLARSISGDRIFILESGTDAIEGHLQAAVDIKLSNRLLYWLLRPVLKEELRWQLRKYAAWEQMADKPYFQQRELLKAEPLAMGDVPWRFKLTGFQDGGAYGTVFLKNGQLEASYLVARTGLACRLFKSRAGAYPESLEALVPAILAEVPIDPFTGKPLVYRREGEGFIVYSLGSNEKDDGGRSTYMITQMVMEKDDDWTWKELW